jgi:hypothetical protein
VVSGSICISLEQKRKKSADIEKWKCQRPEEGFSSLSGAELSLNVPIVKRFYSNDISVHVFKGIY